MILTKNNANERCRTCLRKIWKNEENSNEAGNINSNKEIRELLEKHLPIQCQADFHKDHLYPQCVCMECLNHLKTFDIFRNKAIDSVKKLYRIFSKNNNLSKIQLNDDGQECKVDAEEHSSNCAKDNIFNLFLKDSLMETEAIILDNADTNNDFDNMDPDPFQNTQKHDFMKKPRRRRAKSKNEYISSSKATIRKSKRNSIEKHSIKKLESTLRNKNKAGQTENDDQFDWQDNSFQEPNGGSSDNEALSKMTIHSDREVKEAEENQLNNANLENNFLFSNNNYCAESVEDQCKGGLNEKIIKSELDWEAEEMSNDFEFNNNTEILQNSITIAKKKRHYILNSGRKKGLANRYKCDQCQHKFGHKLTLEAHVRKVHEGQKKAFKCQLCEKAYSFIGGLSTHIRDVHERKQDSYDCSVPGCDKKYSNFITLQRHVRFKHLNMETPHQYVCEQCGATFKQSSNLRYHMKTRHPTEEDLKRKELLPKDRLECEECKKSFHSQYTLKYHKLRVHADEKKFECKICGRRVAKQFMLDSHMLVHSDQKMACKFCGREFVRKYQVEAHIRAVHQKLKPFQCPHCSESFASRKTLRHHIYIHTGEKPYVCDVCGQAYRQPTCLKNHRKIHSKLCASNATTANRSCNLVKNNNALAVEKNTVLK